MNPLLTESVDFRHGNRSLPLKNGGEDGFWNGSFEQIPLDPPFSKGEVAAIPPARRLSTLSQGGGEGKVDLAEDERIEQPALTPPS